MSSGQPIEGFAQQRYALVLLIKEIMSQLDEVAALKKKNMKADVSMLLLKEMCSVLRDLPPELEEEYFRILPSLVGTSNPSTPPIDKESVEIVAPVKKRFIQKIREDLKIAI